MATMAQETKMTARQVVLNSGNTFHLVGFGTYKITGKNLIYKVLDAALASGYRSIDTAECYHNEHEIGTALKQLLPKYKLERKDIQLTSKLFTTDQGTGLARAAALKSIATLQTDYLDLYLIHWPGAGKVLASSPENKRLRRESWMDLVQLYKEGIIKSIGVSNYTIRHLKELLADCGGVRPDVNQVELHPRYPQTDLVSFCKQEKILVQAYSSLGGSSDKSLLNDPTVNQVAHQIGKSPAQVLLKWALDKEIAIVPKSVTAERIAQNGELEFELPKELLKSLDEIPIREKYAWDPEIVA